MKRRRAGNDSADEDLTSSKMAHFTPGRIRASRMTGSNNMLDYNG